MQRAPGLHQRVGVFGECDGMTFDPLERAFGEDDVVARDPWQLVEFDQ